MEEKAKFIGIMGLIALRKSELYSKIISELSKQNKLSEEDHTKVKIYIAQLDNEKLLSEKEKKTKVINPELKLEDIDFDVKSIIEELKF